MNLLEYVQFAAFFKYGLVQGLQFSLLTVDLFSKLREVVFAFVNFVDQWLAQILNEVAHFGFDVKPENVERRKVLREWSTASTSGHPWLLLPRPLWTLRFVSAALVLAFLLGFLGVSIPSAIALLLLLGPRNEILFGVVLPHRRLLRP